MQNLPLLSARGAPCDSKQIKQLKSGIATGFIMERFGHKRSTYDRRCLFPDNTQAVMLAHNTIGSLETHGFAAKNAYELLNCVSVVRCVAQECPAGLYVVREDLLGVWWNTEQEGFQCDHYVAMGSFRALSKERKDF